MGNPDLGKNNEADQQGEVVIAPRILGGLARGPVVLAADLATIFGVSTSALNQAFKRNSARFAAHHSFELNPEELSVLMSQNVISRRGHGGANRAPRVYTQKGALLMATLLRSRRAYEVTDSIIDLFMEVYQQVAAGRAEIAISRPSELLAETSSAAEVRNFKSRLLDALNNLLDTQISPTRQTTVRDEISDLSGGALDLMKEHMRTKGLENERIAADTFMILARVQELRTKTEADRSKAMAEAEKLALENLDKKISIVERLLKMASEMEPKAIAQLNGIFMSAPGVALREEQKPQLMLNHQATVALPH